MTNIFSKISIQKVLKNKILDRNKNALENFVKVELLKLKKGSTILDAGCGDQKYKKYCSHLKYSSQDFKKYSNDQKKSIDSKSKDRNYKYPNINYVGNIWDISEKDSTFDTILCTEVFEHIPYPENTLKEFKRLLKKNGKLILTAPANSIRHFDPYYYYSGFSDRWYEYFLNKYNFKILSIKASGGYYSYLSTELARVGWQEKSIFAKLIVAPALLFFLNKRETPESIDTTCNGYYVLAISK